MSRTTILYASLAFVILGGAYWYFGTGSSEAPLTAGDATTPAAQEFLDLAGKLTPVSFDTSIFTDARFNALVDISTTITPESQGRVDPFAPLGR